MVLSRGSKVAIWIAVIATAAGGLLAVLIIRRANLRPPITLEGAVIRQASPADKEVPLSGVEITASVGTVSASCKSDSMGFFKVTLPGGRKSRAPITLRFRHSGYQPLVLPVISGGRLYVARMSPTAWQSGTPIQGSPVAISNISVRYSATRTTAVNVGSTAKTFQVVNTAGVPCNHQKPCSPDGKWKGAKSSISLDAGEGNVFRNVRVSCIAGPCPFTRITPQKFPRQERRIKVEALDWSDTATFLVEAEVYHPLQNAEVHKSYPVIFGRVMNFTLPPSAEGVCIEADMQGNHIIFPLGPNPPVLQWADCSVRSGENKTKAYRCELKDGYRF